MGTTDPMNAHDLLDHALGQLDGPARERADQELAADLEAAESAERLIRSLRRLLDDGETFEPPPDLARRTIAFVSESARRKRTILDFVPVRVPFRPADVAVAAGIFLAGVLTLLPAVQKSKERMEVAGCGYNLQQLGRALWQYGSRHQHFPVCPEKNPDAPVGTLFAMLHDNGLLNNSDLNALDCPCDGPGVQHPPIPDCQTLCRLHKADPKRAHEALRTGYGYNVGYHHASTGKVVPISADHQGTVPLLADQPPHQGFRQSLEGNSPNHRGRGQNVLYADLHVGWHNTRRISPKDDDMYTNAHHKFAPGVRENDTAILPSMVPFHGW